MNNDDLKDYVSKSSKFFSLDDNQEKIVRFLDYEIVSNRFNPSLKCVRYHLEVDGVVQLLDRSSCNLAKQMSDIPKGTIIGIRKSGFGPKTQYFIRRITEE